MSLDLRTGQLKNAAMAKGRYNRIEMNRGTIDWHSHPGKCLNDNMCALGLPSPQDIFNVIVGSLHGTKAHLVYAKEGTYMIQMEPKTLARLMQNRSQREEFEERLFWTLEALHKHFVNNPKISYQTYRRKWIQAAKQLGVTVRFFSKNRVPWLDLKYDCAAESMGVVTPSVEVEPNEENAPKKKSKNLKSEIKKRIEKLFGAGKRLRQKRAFTRRSNKA